jgi:hypothetical protein
MDISIVILLESLRNENHGVRPHAEAFYRPGQISGRLQSAMVAAGGQADETHQRCRLSRRVAWSTGRHYLRYALLIRCRDGPCEKKYWCFLGG